MAIALTAVATLEVSLRLILGLGSPLLYVPDALCGYRPKSDQRLHRFFVEIDTDRFGMRSIDVPDARQKGEYRILFVGDSVAFGTTYVDQRDIFSSRIQRLLADRKQGAVSVMNASARGWAPSNEMALIKSQGIHDANMVVMVYNTKDLDQPFSHLIESPVTPIRKPESAIGELWARYLRPRILTGVAYHDPGSTGADSPPVASAVESVLQTISETQRLVESQGARFVILFTPVATADVHTHQADWDAALQKLKRWANQESVTLLDMTPAFNGRDAKKVYFDGIHLRSFGDEIVADSFVALLGDQLQHD